MFDFFGRLFGSAKAGEKIVDGIVQATDKIWYTEEEKADAAAKAKSEGYQVYMKWLESTSGSRIARRFLALIVTGIWALEHVASVFLGVLAVFVENKVSVDNAAAVVQANVFTEASKMLADQAYNNNALVGVVLLFYFGGPAAVTASQGLVEKWVNRKTNFEKRA